MYKIKVHVDIGCNERGDELAKHGKDKGHVQMGKTPIQTCTCNTKPFPKWLVTLQVRDIKQKPSKVLKNTPYDMMRK